MDEFNRQFIESEKEEILRRLQGAHLFGELIDFEDTDMVIVAAHYLGEQRIYFMRYGLESEILYWDKENGQTEPD